MKVLKESFWVVALLSALSYPAWATVIPSIPYNLTNGTLADATQVMGDFNTIVTDVNANAATAGVNSNITSLVGLTTPLSNVYGGTVVFTGGTTGGTANAQTLASVVPSAFALTAGNFVTAIAGYSNTGAATLAVSGGAATAIRIPSTTGPIPLRGGEIATGNEVTFLYDGTYFQLLNPIAVPLLYPPAEGALCDGSTDDSTALQAWLTAGAAGTPLGIGNYTCVFKTPLTLSNPNNLSIEGTDQENSLLAYAGASTIADPITIGTTSGAVTSGVFLNNFGIIDNTTMTAGTTLHLKKVNYSELNVSIGTPSNLNAYNGIWQDSGSFLDMTTSQIYASNDGIRTNNGVELHMDETLIQGTTTGNAIHIGGGFGGFYADSVDTIYYSISLLVDTSLTSAGNNQIFIGPNSVFDSAVNAGCYFNDAYVTSKAAFMDGWFSSVSAGNSCVVVNWASGIFYSGSGKFYNASGNGLTLEDATVNYSFGTTALIADNGGYGIAATVPLTIHTTATPFNNITASYNTNVLIASKMGAWTTAATGTITHALTDGFLVGYTTGVANTNIITDSVATPTTIRQTVGNDGAGAIYGGFNVPVRSGDYWEITNSLGAGGVAYWIPLNQ